MRTIHRRLIDALNAEPEEMLLVEQVGVHEQYGRPRDGRVGCRGGVAIPNVLYCVPVEDSETPPAPRDTHAWVVKTPERVELGAGPFEFTGYLHLPEGASLEDTLGIVRKRFVALTEVTIRRLDDKEFYQEYPVVVINGRRVEYVVPAESRCDGPTADGSAATATVEADAAAP